MSETGRSGINRAFSWLKRTLQITEKTVAPDQLSSIVLPTMDVFGWERLAQFEFETATSGVGASNVQFAAVPADVIHLYLYASVRVNIAGPSNIWVGIRTAGGGTVAITPSASAVSAQKVAPLAKPVIIPTGGQLEGRSESGIVAGALTLEAFRLVLPVGEYVPPS